MKSKNKIEDQAYQENSAFWTEKGDECTVVGDFLGRMPSIEIISPKEKEIILDAGCGAGFIARHLARKGAKVFACDRNERMLAQAINQEKKVPLGIEYCKSDIINLPYETETFDKIACIAVLIHDSPEECLKFFQESKRTLKQGGKIFLSLMHPKLYCPESPARNQKASWVQYKPLDNLPMEQSQRFFEDYKNSNGRTFNSIVWYQSEEILVSLLQRAGFEVSSSHTQYITKKSLEDSKQTGEIGYPGFLQIVAQKV